MLISRRLLLILCQRHRTPLKISLRTQEAYLLLTGTSKDVFLSCSMMSVKEKKMPQNSLRFLSILKLPLLNQASLNREVVRKTSLEKLWRSKYDLRGKFGDGVNKIINPLCIKVHKEARTRRSDLLEKRPTNGGKQSWKFIYKVGYNCLFWVIALWKPERKGNLY